MGQTAGKARRRAVKVTLDARLLARVDKTARREGVTRSEAIGRLLDEAMREDEEDTRLAEVAEAAFSDPANQEEIPLAAVKARSGL